MKHVDLLIQNNVSKEHSHDERSSGSSEQICGRILQAWAVTIHVWNESVIEDSCILPGVSLTRGLANSGL